MSLKSNKFESLSTLYYFHYTDVYFAELFPFPQIKRILLIFLSKFFLGSHVVLYIDFSEAVLFVIFKKEIKARDVGNNKALAPTKFSNIERRPQPNPTVSHVLQNEKDKE